MPDDVADRVKKVTGRVLGCDPAALTDKTSFAGDLGAESLDSIKLVVAFEEEFGIEMDEDAALKVQTVGKAVEFIRQTIEGAK
jgi:acyl carrier protein